MYQPFVWRLFCHRFVGTKSDFTDELVTSSPKDVTPLFRLKSECT